MFNTLRREQLIRSPESIYDPERDGIIEFEGDPEVIDALIRQAENVRQGREDLDIRIALFILPGGIRGVTSGGIVTALHERGLTNGIQVVIGGSTGAHIAAWFLAGDPRLGTTIFSQECVSRDFIRMKRIVDGYGMDAGLLSQLYRGEWGKKKLPIDRIQHAKPDFLIAATEYQTGKGVLLNGKREPIIDKIEASSAAGPLYTDPVFIDKIRYGDATASEYYFPFEEIKKRYHPTHVLVLANRPKEAKDTLTERIGDRVLSSLLLPSAYRKGWLSREESYARSLKILRDSTIPYLLINTDRSVNSLSKDAQKNAAAAERGEDFMLKFIDVREAA